jgi:hypothetical protein
VILTTQKSESLGPKNHFFRNNFPKKGQKQQFGADTGQNVSIVQF